MNNRELEKNERSITRCEGENSIQVKFSSSSHFKINKINKIG
jgi:hypothetical protein